jgi:hypothetical protein
MGTLQGARRGVAALLLACAGALSPASARAQASDAGAPGTYLWRPGAWHAALGYRADWFSVPGLTTGLANNFSGSGGLPVFFTHRFGGLSVHSLVGEGGYAFAPGALPAWLGANARVVVFGQWGGATSQGSFLQRRSPDGWSVVSVDGLRLGESFGDRLLRSRADVTEKRSSIGLRATTDYALAPAWWVSAEVAAFIGRARRAYAVVEDLDRGDSDDDSSPFAIVRTVDARIHTREYGGVLGLRFTWRPIETLSVFAAGRVALLWRRVRLDAHDCLGDNLGTFAAPFCTGSLFVTATSQRHAGFVAMPGSEIGFAYAPVAGIVVRVAGGIDYDPRSPGVRLPTATDRRPASLTFHGAVIYSVQATLTVALW